MTEIVRQKEGRIPHITTDVKIYIKNAPVVQSDFGEFIPNKILIRIWPDRAHVTVSAPGEYPKHKFPYSKKFDLYGHEGRYEPCPDWLLEVIREALWGVGPLALFENKVGR